MNQTRENFLRYPDLVQVTLSKKKSRSQINDKRLFFRECFFGILVKNILFIIN